MNAENYKKKKIIIIISEGRPRKKVYSKNKSWKVRAKQIKRNEARKFCTISRGVMAGFQPRKSV